MATYVTWHVSKAFKEYHQSTKRMLLWFRLSYPSVAVSFQFFSWGSSQPGNFLSKIREIIRCGLHWPTIFERIEHIEHVGHMWWYMGILKLVYWNLPTYYTTKHHKAHILFSDQAPRARRTIKVSLAADRTDKLLDDFLVEKTAEQTHPL